MHYPQIKRSFYSRLPEVLSEMVPEFCPENYSDDGVYVLFGDFCQFLLKNLDDRQITRKIFDFVDRVLQDGDPEAVTVIELEIFECLLEDRENIQRAKPNMNSRVLNAFEQFQERYEDFVKGVEESRE